jgi:formylglycine-generating enzyme required for sulfatase activity
MGSERFYPEEAPLRRVRVDGFWIDETPVTNAQFAAFVAATGYRTAAEIPPDPRDYPGMPAHMVRPGSLLFQPTQGRVDLRDYRQWWEFCFGADWRHPTGPRSSLLGLEQHPVVHVAYDDVLAYAEWAGKELPSEAEWEYAARGGHDDGRDYAWGDELAPGGAMLANYWQGPFPYANSLLDGWERTSPVRSYPPNDYGLYDMIGNVWEWTADWYAEPAPQAKPAVQDAGVKSCCALDNPRGPKRADSYDPLLPGMQVPRRVIKGGSHLCAESYCRRYRPAARHPQTLDTSTSHIGFRCILRY